MADLDADAPVDIVELSMASLPQPEEIGRAVSRTDSGRSSASQPSASQGEEDGPDRATSGSGSLASVEVGDKGSEERLPVKPVDAKSSALKALAGISAIVSKSRKIDAEALQQIKSQRAKAKAEGAMQSQLERARSGTPPPPSQSSAAEVSPFAAAQGSSGAAGMARAPSLSEGLPINAQTPQHSHGHSHAALPVVGPLPLHSPPQGGRGPLQSRGSFNSGSHQSPPPGSAPPVGPGSFDEMVSKLTLGELLALKEAVERQLTKQALSLAGLQAAGAAGTPTAAAQAQAPSAADVLSAQYAAALLHNTQAAHAQVAAAQAAVAQQQQQQAQQQAIHQAIAVAAAASGVTLVSTGGSGMSPEAALAGGPHGQALGISPYNSAAMSSTQSLPILTSSQNIPMLSSSHASIPAVMTSSQNIPQLPPQDHGGAGMSTPFASPAAYCHGSSDNFSPPLRSVAAAAAMAQHHQQQQHGGGAAAVAAAGRRGSGGPEPPSGASSPSTTSAEAHLIGDSLHMMLDAGGRPVVQQHSSSLGLAWAEAAAQGGCAATMPVLPHVRQGSSGGSMAWAAADGGQGALLAPMHRSKSLPQQQEEVVGYHQDASPALSSYLATAVDLSQQSQLPSLFGQLRLQQAMGRAEAGQVYAQAQGPPQRQPPLLRQQQSSHTQLSPIAEPTWP